MSPSSAAGGRPGQPPREAGRANPGLASRFRDVRGATCRLCDPLAPEDCVVQSMADASPTKWHLAHTTWFFETFVLERALSDHCPFHPQFRVLFNSYYNAVGEQHPRPRRGLLTRPTLDEVWSYREHVDERMERLLEGGVAPSLAAVVELGLHHEQQHQELILTDLKHAFAANPLRPAYRETKLPPARRRRRRWVPFDEGVCWIGAEEGGFAFDNECPRHRVFAEAFELASHPATNAEYLSFIEDGGYRRPELWLSDGWDRVQREGWRAPLYWERREGRWVLMTLSGLREVRPEEPVCHVSYYEADAFAAWTGARLPSEVEWERAAARVPPEGHFVEDGCLHPASAGEASQHPEQLFGDVWEWTRSSYGPYPGYRAPEGALGEYNGKFMASQMVLRGGSCVTPRSHIRATYRNFFFPEARWQFSGIRLARDVG